MRKVIAALLFFAPIASAASSPLTIVGATRATPDLPLVAGVQNIEVFHATADGWTYNHHVDMAIWKGRLYVAWDSCQKDEDVGASRELYSTSQDGLHWSPPALLFPQGSSTALRMYFFHGSDGQMLAIAGMRLSDNTPASVAKGGVIVREIHADHILGDVFALIAPKGAASKFELYRNSNDPPFVAACAELLANKSFLEQQDYGRLLGNQRMRWHDLANWPASEPSRADFANRFGKAMCFFRRADGALVDVMKWGWVTLSRDEGETWSQPTRPPTLVTGMAKVWGQRTPRGHYVLIYNPDPFNRWPLVLVRSSDGITFGDMRTVNGSHPPIRFPGKFKVEGAQYPRGVSEWSSDGSFKDDCFYVAYSMGKEDIYVARIPDPELIFRRSRSQAR